MVIQHTIDVCVAAECVDEIIVVTSGEYVDFLGNKLSGAMLKKPIRVVRGGNTRKESAACGMNAIQDADAKVLIHNAVQPFVTVKTFEDCVAALDRYDAVTVGSPSVYTVLELDDRQVLRRIVDRQHSFNDLGPECFTLAFLRRLYQAGEGDDSFTNLTGMVMKYGLGDVYVVNGDPSNIKITYADDIALAKKILEERRLRQ